MTVRSRRPPRTGAEPRTARSSPDRQPARHRRNRRTRPHAACGRAPLARPADRYPGEWLADNGSCSRPHETVAFAHAIGLVPCFTPVRSPQSNGITEAFVKTFKRDYVRLSARPDATALLAELDRWFEDHNEMHPHRALGMLRSDGDNSSLHTARDLSPPPQADPKRVAWVHRPL
jgi:transposase InsO family protein